MKLNDFISKSIVEFVEGVVEGHNNVYQLGARVNPHRNSNWVHNLEFDIAVTASEDTTEKIGFGVFVAAITGGVSAQNDNKSAHQSRIKFSIPIELPVGFEAPMKPIDAKK